MKKTFIILGISLLVILAIFLFIPKENDITPQISQPQNSSKEDNIPNAVLDYEPGFPPGSYEAYIRDLASGEYFSGESGEPII